MKYYVTLLCIVFAVPAFAEAINGGLNQERVERCRQQRFSKARVYVEDMEYCQGVLMRDSIEKFNQFVDRRGPVVDCQEAKDNPRLVNACRAVGIRKVKAQASSWGISVRDQDVYACDVDDSHWIMPNYVWFCADTPRGEIRQMTQKPRLMDCF